jgi:hypothetical protein
MVMATAPIGTHLAPTTVDAPFIIHNHNYGGPPYLKYLAHNVPIKTLVMVNILNKMHLKSTIIYTNFETHLALVMV